MKVTEKKHLKVKSIKNGTVIDHITANRALSVLNILNLPDEDTSLTVAMNVESPDMSRKDIVKIENRELSQDEVDKLVLIAPNATINIIRDYEITRKARLELKDEISDVITCSNPNCISNSNEPIKTKFYVQSKKPVILRCHFCERTMDLDDIEEQF
ncbi:aspartate carbamoyltransferase regulatory subunit [Methanosphaera sp. BMS]|uniref:aspartate carbamoyltransferase regulatory subunit n=1 Tax=Methanosphaera sp. BMS TaxID=1789762 RepID=UPI0019551791|nr:aspartate carbamoyltransferase regulatory subunit [Methanosphaera sp. BMS]